ncbi:winged helix-turn-helix transcriptional regulator [Halobaculum marinum]|uniref:Winged helix-turn-helix transcriptional regulator n=1 Tax=Halobaculum marinum TaxID=3031996 RepID=A0ABD5X2F0_9EURY|nr:helix-turn-helix domain-containing protein [Halobaculum sp. DT55]
MTANDPDDWRRRLDDLHDALSGKWALHVLRSLRDTPRGFGELRADLDGVSEKTLSRRLRELRCRGLITREMLPRSPPEPRYSLTPAGDRLVTVLSGMERSVEYVDCPDEYGCADDCTVATLDPAVTRQALLEQC